MKRILLLPIMALALLISSMPLVHAAFSDDEMNLPSIDWSGIEARTRVFKTSIDGIFKSDIALNFDHDSFNKHFDLQKAKPKMSEKDHEDAQNYCGSESLSWLWQGSPYGYDQRCTAASADVKNQVKTIVCQISETGHDSLHLDGDKLVLTMVPGDQSSYGWMEKEWEKVFPSYGQCRAQYAP